MNLTTLRAWGAVVATLGAQPRLWPVALRQWRRLTPRRWWRRRPWLPIPDRTYLAFRQLTHYGDTAAPPAPADVTRYLAWCRDAHRAGAADRRGP